MMENKVMILKKYPIQNLGKYAQKGIMVGKDSPFYGKNHSKNTKERLSEALRGSRNGNWKGGIARTKTGYIKILRPNHLQTGSRRYDLRSRLVMEKRLGRSLKSKEIVHHINSIKDDDRSENLYLFPDRNSHMNYESNPRETYFRWIRAK